MRQANRDEAQTIKTVGSRPIIALGKHPAEFETLRQVGFGA